MVALPLYCERVYVYLVKRNEIATDYIGKNHWGVEASKLLLYYIWIAGENKKNRFVYCSGRRFLGQQNAELDCYLHKANDISDSVWFQWGIMNESNI